MTMNIPKCLLLVCAVLLSIPLSSQADERWVIDSQEEWTAGSLSHDGLEITNGAISPTANKGSFQSKIVGFDKKQRLASITIEQSPIWQNWQPIENLGPVNLSDAPVLLTIGPDNYWMFGRYSAPKKQQRKKGNKQESAFKPQAARLAGFDIPLQTTPFPNQYNAPGGLKAGKGGYHAWQSKDMKNWVHHGPVTEGFSRWVTSAEYVDGKTLIYYDYPNDQDPHVYVDEDLTDGIPGENKGMAFKDPSHGSDSGFIRDLNGKMHVIYEDWSPINASKRSWDSPLAGHAVSDDGIQDFKILSPAIDNRTRPTGKIAEYKHPHWAAHPDWNTNIGKYEIHEPEQEAYGDWAAICIGGQYYLFGDYDPVGGHAMSVGWFTTSDLSKEFQWCDKIGNGHPDPDVCFAEGMFYLATQQKTDYISPGPWVESVEVRLHIDTDNDGKTDKSTEWTAVQESYDYIPGFSKQIKKEPASLDLSKVPAGYHFQLELRLTDTTENKSKPIVKKVQIDFK